MSFFIRIFCKSQKSISRRDLAELISDGAFFDEEPGFDPPLTSHEIDAKHWDSFKVSYKHDLRPIVIEQNLKDELLKEEIDELLFILNRSRETKAQRNVLKHLHETVQTFSLEINPGSLTDDCWEMMDVVESYIAKSCDGIVYSPDEGFYNKDLKHIYRL